MREKSETRLQAFTLIEILVVLTIIGLLLSFVAPMILDRPNQARTLKAHSDLQAIKAALSLYYIDNGRLPSDSEGIEILFQEGTNGAYLAEQPFDPWGNGYEYRVRGNGLAILISNGPDGELGSEDDIEIEVKR